MSILHLDMVYGGMGACLVCAYGPLLLLVRRVSSLCLGFCRPEGDQSGFSESQKLRTKRCAQRGMPYQNGKPGTKHRAAWLWSVNVYMCVR